MKAVLKETLCKALNENVLKTDTSKTLALLLTLRTPPALSNNTRRAAGGSAVLINIT